MSTGRMASSSTAPGTPTVERTRPPLSSASSNNSIASADPSQAISLFSQTTSSTLTVKPESSGPKDGHGDWDEEEDYSAVITRKEHPRDGAGLLGLRDVLRNQRPVESPSSSASVMSGSGSNTGMATGGGVSSHFRSLGDSASKLIRYGIGPSSDSSDHPNAPPSAWAKAELQVSLKPAQGELRAIDTGTLSDGVGEEKLLEILANLESGNPGDSRPELAEGGSRGLGSSSTVKSSPSKLVKAPSAVEEADEDSILSGSLPALNHTDTGPSEERLTSESNVVRSNTEKLSPSDHSKQSTSRTVGPPVPPKVASGEVAPTAPSLPSRQSRILISASSSPDRNLPSRPSTNASNTGSITSTVASAIRYVLGTPGPSPPPKQHLGLLAMHQSTGTGSLYPPIDDRPHLKYDFTLGELL